MIDNNPFISDYQQDGGAALCCEEAGCIEYFV